MVFFVCIRTAKRSLLLALDRGRDEGQHDGGGDQTRRDGLLGACRVFRGAGGEVAERGVGEGCAGEEWEGHRRSGWRGEGGFGDRAGTNPVVIGCAAAVIAAVMQV
jgi:hypothetical protein